MSNFNSIRFDSFITTDDEHTVESDFEFPEEDLMVYEILRISLNALWVNQILLKIDELLKNFPTSSHFVQLLKERNDKIMLQMFCGLDDSFCDKNRSEEVKMIVWFNHVSEMLGVLEGILTQLKLVPRYQIEVESQPSSLIGTFEKILTSLGMSEVDTV